MLLRVEGPEKLRCAEHALFEGALELTGTKARAAKMLGLDDSTFQRRLSRFRETV